MHSGGETYAFVFPLTYFLEIECLSQAVTLPSVCVFVQGLAVGFVLLRVEALVEEGKI